MIFRVLMDNGDVHDITDVHVYRMPTGDTRLALLTEADKAITMQVDEHALRLLGSTCLDGADVLELERRARKAKQN